VLDRRFAPEQLEARNRVWAGDITYIPTREGWLYVAVILDLASRRVVGWSMGRTLEALRPTQAVLRHITSFMWYQSDITVDGN
jgi:transposase InsO family protein